MIIGGARRLRTATRATMQLRSHAKWEAEALAVPAAPSRPLSARRSARNGEIKAEVKAEEIKVEAVAATVRATGLRVKREPSPKTPDLSVVVKREAKTPSPRKKKAKTRVPRAEPPKWREQLKGIQEMRAKKDAEVDTHGCDVFFDPSKYPAHVARYHVLIAAMMSSQTKDPVNAAAMGRLIEHGLTVQDMLDIDETELAQLIRPVGFFNNKAKYIKQVAAILKERAGDSDVIDIPDTYEELIALPGVGPKMAFLVMDCAWNNTVGICVDTHVHRISNRLKWVKTWNKVNPKSQDPEKTRAELEDWLPREHWGPINPLLVGFGQTICQPRNPKCDKCKIKDICPSANKGTI